MNGGPIEFNAGDATFNFTDGTLHNVGTFGSDLHQMSGTVTPGDGVGAMIIQGNFTQDPGATYMVHLDGNTQSSDFIRVEGSAILNGSITPVVLSQFPVLGNDTPYTFTVLTATDGITETTQAPLLSKLELPPIGHVSKGLTPLLRVISRQQRVTPTATVMSTSQISTSLPQIMIHMGCTRMIGPKVILTKQ